MSESRKSLAPKCRWKRCKATTWDVSGLCYHHRRFSGVNMDNAPGANVPIRVSRVSELSQSYPGQVRDALESSRRGMKYRPRVIAEHGSNHIVIESFVIDGTLRPKTVLWGGRQVSVPGSAEDVDLEYRDGALIVAPKPGANAGQVLTNAMVTSQNQWNTHHGAITGFNNDKAEQYDDEAEAIAQLELGSRYGMQLSVLSEDRKREAIRIDVSNGLTVSGVLTPVFPVYNENDEANVEYQISQLSVREPGSKEWKTGEPYDERFAELLRDVIRVRNLIGKYGVRNINTGGLNLPFGWTDM